MNDNQELQIYAKVRYRLMFDYYKCPDDIDGATLRKKDEKIMLWDECNRELWDEHYRQN